MTPALDPIKHSAYMDLLRAGASFWSINVGPLFRDRVASLSQIRTTSLSLHRISELVGSGPIYSGLY